MSKALTDCIEIACDHAKRQYPGEDHSNERARAFAAALSGALQQDHPELSERVWSVLRAGKKEQAA